MYSAGQRVLLWNTSEQACFWNEQAFQPDSNIEVVFADDVDEAVEAAQVPRGPWGVAGWTFDALTRFAHKISDPATGRVLWHSERVQPWQDYTRSVEHAHSVVGTVKLLPKLWSPQLGNERDILVYLPPSYQHTDRRYPVIYMHDGQNLFDQATAFSCEWGVDETLEATSRYGLEAIVVGIPNMGVERCNEYSPFTDPRHGGGCGDEYLQFIVDTVKPIIDRDFRTLSDRENTGILGSSMGGLISLYAFFQQPSVFGFAGVLSPALWFGDRAIFEFVERADVVPGTIYLDVGTEEGAVTLADTRRMRDLLQQKGYVAACDLHYVEDVGAHHCEAAWAARLHDALYYVLRCNAQQPLLPLIVADEPPVLERALGA